jgi:hypothetical protein
MVQVANGANEIYNPYYWLQEPKRSGADEYNLSGQDENDLCVSNPMHGIINMKRMIMKDMGSGLRLGKRDEDVPMPQWRLMEWARQLHDLERYLAFCNRRNNVSKIRLL